MGILGLMLSLRLIFLSEKQKKQWALQWFPEKPLPALYGIIGLYTGLMLFTLWTAFQSPSGLAIFVSLVTVAFAVKAMMTLICYRHIRGAFLMLAEEKTAFHLLIGSTAAVSLAMLGAGWIIK